MGEDKLVALSGKKLNVRYGVKSVTINFTSKRRFQHSINKKNYLRIVYLGIQLENQSGSLEPSNMFRNTAFYLSLFLWLITLKKSLIILE